jgi:transcription elongation factor Elf1
MTALTSSLELKGPTMREPHAHQLVCTCCYAQRVAPARSRIGYTTCLDCGEKAAKQVKHTVAPMNKSNYMLFTDASMLKQLNPKRTT